MRCNKCGTENTQGAAFCAKCGEPIARRSAYINGQPTGNDEKKQMSFSPNETSTSSRIGNRGTGTPIEHVIPDYDPNFDYRPLKMWSYFGYDILFVIPLVGFILLLVFSFGGTRNINLRNYARSKFCGIIIIGVLIILAIIMTTGTLIFAS